MLYLWSLSSFPADSLEAHESFRLRFLGNPFEKGASDLDWYAKSIQLAEKCKSSPASDKTELAAFLAVETGAARDTHDDG